MDSLCHAIATRIRRSPLDPEYQDDSARLALPAPVSELVIAASERRFGFRLDECYRSVLLSVGNGGFGPGYGILGVGPLGAGSDFGDLVETTMHLMYPEWRGVQAVLVGYWGGGLWSGLECSTGAMLIANDVGVHRLPLSFSDWIGAWAEGEDVLGHMVETQTRFMRHPSSGEVVAYRGMGKKKGVPFPGP